MWQFESEVVSIIPRTPGIRSFRFPIRAKGVRYRAGQYFYINIMIDGKEAEHHFSFSSSPTEKDYIEFTKRITASDFSRALAGLKVGDWARFEGPMGSFTLPRKQFKLAFLSGGIGITPLRSMLRYITDKDLPYDVVLLYGNPTLEEAAFRAELDEMAARRRGIRVEHILSGPGLPQDWRGKTGYINQAIIKELIPDFRERLFYISGPPKMVMALQEQINAFGLPGRQVRHDSFTGYD